MLYILIIVLSLNLYNEFPLEKILFDIMIFK